MKNEYAEFLPTTKLRQKKKLSPKTSELSERQAES